MSAALIALAVTTIELSATTSLTPWCGVTRRLASDEVITYVAAPPFRCIAVRLVPPEKPRYDDVGAPIVIEAAGFFTPTAYTDGFSASLDLTQTATIGILHVSYLWPGESDAKYGARSDGVVGYGSRWDVLAFARVVAFASDLEPNAHGVYLSDFVSRGYLSVEPLVTNVGLYGFSHAGIAATNVVARFGASAASEVDYFVGRENPTLDALSAVEVGHWSGAAAVYNGYYEYPADYDPEALYIDYSTVGWDATYGVPAFAASGSTASYTLGASAPTMFGKTYYSIAMTRALDAVGALPSSGVASVAEVEAAWPARVTVGWGVDSYTDLAAAYPNFKVMLVFAADDHVQVALDKPHIHQAYDGFYDRSGAWVRLNPDLAYVDWAYTHFTYTASSFPDNDANTEPSDWYADARTWGYRNGGVSSTLVPLAALAEMMDRVQTSSWGAADDNLSGVLVSGTVPPS